MKQFRLAAGLVALAMLGACSSEEPITPGGTTVDGVQGMYLSLNIAGPENTTTRATQAASIEENAIRRIQIIISDKDGNQFLTKTINSGDKIETEDGTKVNALQNQTVLFTVTNSQFNEMKTRADEDWEILVYVNGQGTTRNGVMYGATENYTWYTEGYNELGFAMSNAAECKGKLNAIGSNDGKTPATAWEIAATVNLSRLATRFDYVEKAGGNSYTLLSDDKVNLEIVGIGVNTMATKTFRIAQFSTDGRLPSGEGNAKSCTHFTNNGDETNLFRVTDVYDVDTDGYTGDYPDNYTEQSLFLIPGTKTTIYARPNTISNGTTLSYKKVPYAVVKAKITVNGADENSSYAEHDPIFAINGVLIGGARDLHALIAKKEDFKVTYNADNFSQDDKDDIEKLIEDVEKAVNDYMKNHTHTDLNVPANLTKANKDIVDFLHAERYDYDETNDGYFTYYASYIQHSNSSNDSWRYGVSRNTVYQLGVSSFGLLGNNGTGEIGDGPKVSDIQDLIMKLTVTVSDWELNDLNKGWNL